MDDNLKGFLGRVMQAEDAQARVDETYAEEMGYDAGKNGANTTNSHFAIFSQPQYTKAWERGKQRAEREQSSGDVDEQR